jgi:hypothetical protein
VTKVDWTKPLQTAEVPPRPVRCISPGRKDICGFHRVILIDSGPCEAVIAANDEGLVAGSGIFVVNVPQKHTRYANVYRRSDNDEQFVGGSLSESVGTAVHIAKGMPRLVAVAVPVTFTEGQGLELLEPKKPEPFVVDKPGQYIERRGGEATVDRINAGDTYPAVGKSSTGVYHSWTRTGRTHSDCDNWPTDLVAKAPQ